MLKPEDIQGIANDLTSVISELEDTCIRSIASRIGKGGTGIENADVWRLRKLDEAGALKKDLLAKASRTIRTSTTEQVCKIIRSSLYRSAMLDKEAIASVMAGLSATGLADIASSPGFQAALNRALKGARSLLNMTGTTAMQAGTQAYLDAINRAYLVSVTSIGTVEDGVRQAMIDLGNRGLRVVDSPARVTEKGELVRTRGNYYTTYKVGDMGTVRSYPLDSAIRRDLVTSINRTCAGMTLDTCSELGAKLVETSWHVGARPEHERWQGKVFSLDPDDKRYPYFYASQEDGGTGYGDMLGLCGINCYHSFSPFFEGSTQSDKEGKPSEAENRKAYEEQQVQRNYERRLRSLSREKLALEESGLDEDSLSIQGKLQACFAEYENFLKETGRRRISILDGNYGEE